MAHTAVIQKYDDDHHFIPLDDAMLFDLGLKEGDDVVITLEQIDKTQMAIKVIPASEKPQQG